MLSRWLMLTGMLGMLLTSTACSPAKEDGGPLPEPVPVKAPASTGKPEDAAQPGELQLERPTLICLGAHWPVQGDANHNARVTCAYRKTGETAWRAAQDFFAVDRQAWDGLTKNNGEKEAQRDWAPPAGTVDFAGSVMELHPDTAYELKITLIDPDGGGVEKIVKAHTRPIPQDPTGGRTLHVIPAPANSAANRGKGTADDPFNGLDAAQTHAQPGDIFLLHQGVYTGTFTVTACGEPGKEIVWKGAGDGEAVLDGQGAAATRPGRTISACDIHDVTFEDLSVINADFDIVCHRSQRMVIRRCHIYKTDNGITSTNNPKTGVLVDCYWADNLIEGPSVWPRSKGIEDTEGIQIGGEGSVVCYNTVRGFGDALSTYQHMHDCAIDFYANELSECTDDGIEMDYSLRNTRCFRNRLTNCFQGISVQPIYGGPCYIFRNAMLNIGAEPFKIHNAPSGILIFHNTVVKTGMPETVMTPAPVDRCIFRNNLFIGTSASYGMELDSPMTRSDFDYDGFAGEWQNLFKWNNVKYPGVSDKNPAEQHATILTAAGCFASKLLPPADVKDQLPIAANDCRLAAGSGAIDKGIALANINDGFGGKAPDLGAYERGQPLPWYGVRKAGDTQEESVWVAPAESTTPAADQPAARPVAEPLPTPAP